MNQGYGLDLLAVGPHPDDVELFCGGLIVKTSQSNKQVGVLDLTRGELSSQGTLETRAQETAAAAQVLGLSMRENLELPDGAIGASAGALEPHSDSQLGKVIRALRKHRPLVLAVPYWEARHPDHSSASELLTRAIFFAGVRKFLPELGAPYTPGQVLFYQMRHEFRASFICDITSVHERKMQAVRCYQSQVTAPKGSNQAPTLLSSPLSLQALEARDRFYGAMIGAEFAEPFLTQNMLSLDDPVGYFKALGERRSYILPAKL